MRQGTRRPGFISLAISGGAIAGIIAIGILLLSAMDKGGWTFAGAIMGLVVIVGLIIGGITFGMNLFERRSDKRLEETKEHHRHIEATLKLGIMPPDEYGYTPFQPQQIAAPRQESKPDDPRRQLLIDLCLMTIRADGYGPTSKRLMTADDAQATSKARGGQFADRNNWDKASKFGQETHFLWTKIGGSEQGLRIDSGTAGGDTVADLISALMKYNGIMDSAVNALPGIDR